MCLSVDIESKYFPTTLEDECSKPFILCTVCVCGGGGGGGGFGFFLVSF